jgi:mannosyltransferase OCH1-like enzyme
MIPKIIHQTWKDDHIPYQVFDSRWIESWTKLNPGYEYRFWSDSDIRDLILANYPWFLLTFDNYDLPIKRVDAGKFFLLHYYGGIYADLDCECLKPFDDILKGRDCLIPPEYDSVAGPVCSNAMMASSVENPFIEHCMHRLMLHHTEHVLNATGPFFLTEAYNEWDDKSVFIRDEKFFPWIYSDKIHPNSKGIIYPESYAVHRSQVTWGWQESKQWTTPKMP